MRSAGAWALVSSSCSWSLFEVPRAMANGSAAAKGLVLAFVAVAALCCAPGAAELPRLEHSPKNAGSLKLLVVGDWGRKGTHNQSQVAEQMGRVGEKLGIDFVISTGDNFYKNGLKGVHDRAFEESFTDIYTAKSLQKPWYLVLGNHDYRGNAVAQLSPVLRKIDNRFICMRSFIVNAEHVDFFFVDTTPFQREYWTHPGNHHYDWRGVAPRGKYIANLLKDLDVAMKKSSARWKIVVGHHTMRSVSEHGDTEELLQLLLRVLKENGIDFYINGHDHCLEHISSRDTIRYRSAPVFHKRRRFEGMERNHPSKQRQAPVLLRRARVHVPPAEPRPGSLHLLRRLREDTVPMELKQNQTSQALHLSG